MQDAFAYCAELVRNADRDRFLASLFAPAQHRDALFALYAFAIEIERVREVAREALPGEIRLQWWSEVLAGERGGEAAGNPVAGALLGAVERYSLATNKLAGLIEAHRFDLYDEPMATIAELETYAVQTSSAVISLAAQILGTSADAAAEPAGIAYGLTALMRAFPVHAARRQLYLPAELLERHSVRVNDIFAGRSSDGLRAAFAELRGLVRRNLDLARARLLAVPDAAIPAFLPVALVRPSLDRLERGDAFAPGDISPWRRQWLIWRAARNPARIAG
jgi:15-cis-phytoene synthase